MAKRQSNTPRNVVRLDEVGKIHNEGRNALTPLCGLRNHEDHTWVPTTDDVDCVRCVKLSEKQSDARDRLEYATRAAESQDEVMSQAPVIKAVEPIQGADGENVTVPVSEDSTERRELDASKGERVIAEGDMRDVIASLRTPKTPEAESKRDTERAEFVKGMVALRQDDNLSDESINALIRKLQGMRNGVETPETEGFTVTYHEPKNGEALDVEIPPLPKGVNANTWELAHQGNTQGARDYHMRQAKAQEAEALSDTIPCDACGEDLAIKLCDCVSV